MNAYQPRETPTYGYDSTNLSSQCMATPIFGYDVSANWLTASNRYPFVGNTLIFGEFTGKERDSESGLDYFGARYYGSALGRFSSPDPIFFQKAMLVDPQRFNHYAYVRNNPLTLTDPTGEAIQLSDDDKKRQEELEALRHLTGDKGGHYLYDNVVDGKHYVGIYTNGDSGKGADFGDLNKVASDVKGIINSGTVASLNIVHGDDSFATPGGGSATLNSANGGNGADGATFRMSGQINVYVRAPDDDSPYPALDFYKMSNLQSGYQDLDTVLGHELGHTLYRMTTKTYTDSGSNDAARQLENKVWLLKDPNAATRSIH